jgi:hypothetical protein
LLTFLDLLRRFPPARRGRRDDLMISGSEEREEQ